MKIVRDDFGLLQRLPEILSYCDLKIPEGNYFLIQTDQIGYRIQRNQDQIQIDSANKRYALAALMTVAAKENECVYECERQKTFERLGLMLDVARDAVLSVESVKKQIIHLILLGYDYLELYTEDCFCVKNEPKFGYMRGRYTTQELKEMAKFADSLDFELIPCIQTLAHLERIFQHYREYYFTCRDVADILLVDEPRTYQLIENMIATCSECFTSRRINIGMDEAFLLGAGKFRDLHGNEEKISILARHLKKVIDICKKYGFSPSMWGDMFYTAGYSENVEDAIPYAEILKEVELIGWGYSGEEAFFQDQIQKIQKLTDRYSFAGGAWKWVGFTPLNAFSIQNIERSVRICRDNGVQNYLLTAWGDNGAEASYRCIAATEVYLSWNVWNHAKEDLDYMSLALYGYSYQELLSMDLPNQLYDRGEPKYSNPSRYLLYEDILMGISETQAKDSYVTYYRAHAKVLRQLSNRKNSLAVVYRTLYRLCDLLEEKSVLRIRILRAYDQHDQEELRKIADKEIPKAIRRLKKFYDAFLEQWEIENKPFGFEVHDARLGGLMQRMKHVSKVLLRYCAGEIPKIEELEEARLSPEPPENDYDSIQGYHHYIQNVTYGYF